VGLDNQHDLWVTLRNGITHAENSSPLNKITESQGLDGFIESIIKIKKHYISVPH